jgi:hypothetical protein
LLQFAYADPPYIGCSKRWYKEHPDYNGEVDHKDLLQKLYTQFPDGWALSCSMPSLWDIVPNIPKDWGCRIAAWCKPFVGSRWGLGSGKPLYAWEPVIFCGGRKITKGTVIRDYLVCNIIAAQKGRIIPSNRGLVGAKPDEFCYWIFELLNMQPGDELQDLFPGTGRVMRAWKRYQQAGVSLFVGGEQ